MTDTRFMNPWFHQDPPESDPSSGPSATDLYFYGQPGGDAPQFEPPPSEPTPSEPPAAPGWQPERRFDVAVTVPSEPAAPAQSAAPWDLPTFDFSFAETAAPAMTPQAAAAQPVAPAVPQGWDAALFQPRVPSAQELLFGQPAAPEPAPVRELQKKTVILGALLGARIGSPRSAPANFSLAPSPDAASSAGLASPALPDWHNPAGTGVPTPQAFSPTPFQKPAPTPVRPFADQVTSYASPTSPALPAYAGQPSLPTVPTLPDWRNPAGTGVPTPQAFSLTPFQKPTPTPVRPFADQVTSYAGPTSPALPAYAGQRSLPTMPALPDWRNPAGTGAPTPPAFSLTPFQKPAPTSPVRPVPAQATSYASPTSPVLPAYAGQPSLPTVPALPDWRNPAGTGAPTSRAFSPTPFQKPAQTPPVQPVAAQATSYASPTTPALPAYAGQRSLPVAPEPVRAAPAPWAPAVQAPRINPGFEPRRTRPVSPVFSPQPSNPFAPRTQTGAAAGNLRPARGIDVLRPAGFSPSPLPQPVPQAPRQPLAWEVPWLTKPAAFGTPAHAGTPAMIAAQSGLVQPRGADAAARGNTSQTQSEPGQDLSRLPKELSAHHDVQRRAIQNATRAGTAPDRRAGTTSNADAGWPGLNQTSPQLPLLRPVRDPLALSPSGQVGFGELKPYPRAGADSSAGAGWPGLNQTSPQLPILRPVLDPLALSSSGQVGFGELKPYTPSWGDRFAESVGSLIGGDDLRSRHRRQDLAAAARFGLDSTWGVGSAASANEAYRAFERGDNVGGTIDSVSAIIGLVPFSGKPIKTAGNAIKKWLLRPSAPHLPPPKPNYITNPVHPHTIPPGRTAAHVYQVENDYISSAIQTGPGGKPFASIGEAAAALKQQGLVRDDYTFIVGKDGVFAIPKRNFVRTSPQPSGEAGLLHSAPAEARTVPPAIPERAPLISDLRTISAEEANVPFLEKGWFPPYHPGTQVRIFTTQVDLKFARVCGPDNPTGGFLVRPDEIAGLSPKQIQLHLALPKVPTHIQEVLVPAGTKMQSGIVGAQPAWKVPERGGFQYQLLTRIPQTNFSKMRPLND